MLKLASNAFRTVLIIILEELNSFNTLFACPPYGGINAANVGPAMPDSPTFPPDTDVGYISNSAIV